MDSLRGALIIGKKELIEIRRSILKLLIVMLLPVVSIYFVVINKGMTGIWEPEFNLLLTQSFGGLFSLILLKDSITREKGQKTLEVLLSSGVSLFEIIFGKIVPILVIGMFAQLVQGGMAVLLINWLNVSLKYPISLHIFVLMLFIDYIMCAVCLGISILINDDKVSDIGAVGGAFITGCALLLGAFKIRVLTNTGIFILVMIGLLVLSIGVTVGCIKILKHSFLYIKL